MVGAAYGILLSCSPAAESDLKITMPGAETYVLPKDKTSCSSTTQGDIKSQSFEYSTITLNWANTTDSVTIVAAKIDFKSPVLANGSYTCAFTSEELGMVFSQDKVTPWNGTLYPPPATGGSGLPAITNTCAVKCGGLPTDMVVPTGTTAMGTVTVIGIQRSPSGEEKPVKGTATVKLHFGF
jgi:hypothetical protein